MVFCRYVYVIVVSPSTERQCIRVRVNNKYGTKTKHHFIKKTAAHGFNF